MSNTQRKNGALVEESLSRLCNEGEFSIDGRVYVSVGQVAKDSGMSKPTCAKYLSMLFMAECAHWYTWNGMYLYAPRRGE